MALPILDGNQSAATLSTIVTGGQHIPAHTVVSLGSQAISEITSAVSGISVSIGGTQTTTFGAITGSVSVLNFPASQSVTFTQASVTASLPSDVFTNSQTGIASDDGGGQPSYGIQLGYFNVNDGEYITVKSGVGLPISGAVSADTGINLGGSLPSSISSGIVPVVIINDEGKSVNDVGLGLQTFVMNSVTIGTLPSGSLTTRFGSVTTANTAQITSAVTNTSRKYLLAQNISAGTVTIGIGFSPTTTQGIQLPAGGGLTFDAFCPTGAVYWLGAVTGAAFTILEG